MVSMNVFGLLHEARDAMLTHKPAADLWSRLKF